MLELTPWEAERLEEAVGDISFPREPFPVEVEDAQALAYAVFELSASESCFDDRGLNERGQGLARLHAKLLDTPETVALRARARSGDARAALELGRLKLDSFLAALFPEESAHLFRQAFDAGVREAGYAMVELNAEGRALAGVTSEERVELLEEMALAGDSSAALNLLHAPGMPYPDERLVRVLEAVQENCSEAEEWLVRIRAEARG